MGLDVFSAVWPVLSVFGQNIRKTELIVFLFGCSEAASSHCVEIGIELLSGAHLVTNFEVVYLGVVFVA